MIKWVYFKISLLAVMFFFIANPVYAEEQKQLVLITSNKSDIPQLSKKSIRRLYLGRQVDINNYRIVALSNRSDDLLHEVFLQKIMHMSSRTYHRQVVSRLLNRGGKTLAELNDQEDLIREIIRNSNTISYVWRSSIKQHANIKVIQVLWQGKLN